MHRAIAVWLTGHPWRAAVASAISGALSPQMPLPFLVVAGAIAVLVALRFDFRYAVSMALTAAVAASSVVLSVARPNGWLLLAVALLFFGPVLLGGLLRQTRSLNLVFQVVMLGMVVLLCVIYLSLEDPVGMWRQQIETVWAQVTSHGVVLEGDKQMIIAAWSRTMWGALAALALATVFGAVGLSTFDDFLVNGA